jgi:hypothetical protein
MEPYGKKHPKYRIENERHSGIPGTAKALTKGKKEEIRNANRSLKKSERQQAKNELRNYLTMLIGFICLILTACNTEPLTVKYIVIEQPITIEPVQCTFVPMTDQMVEQRLEVFYAVQLAEMERLNKK